MQLAFISLLNIHAVSQNIKLFNLECEISQNASVKMAWNHIYCFVSMILVLNNTLDLFLQTNCAIEWPKMCAAKSFPAVELTLLHTKCHSINLCKVLL